MSYAQLNDSEPYMKFLNVNTKRQVEQYSLKGSYQWPVVRWPEHLLMGRVDINWQREDASIALFGVNYFEILMGISLDW
jgi:hypothetical protein